MPALVWFYRLDPAAIRAMRLRDAQRLITWMERARKEV